MTEATTIDPQALSLESLYREIVDLRERLDDIEDREDRQAIQAAKAKQGSRPGVPWDQAKAELGID